MAEGGETICDARASDALQKRRERARQRYQEQKPLRLAQNKAWSDANKDKVAANKRLYHKTHRARLHEDHHRWYERNKAHVIAKTTSWRKNNQKRVNELSRLAHAKDPMRARRRYLKHTHGLSTETYAQVYKEQSGKCAICSINKDVLHVDHNHSTNQFRGLLCGPCNRAIGLLREDAVILKAAIDYLSRPL